MSAEEAAEIEGLLDHTEDPAESEAAGGAADESIEDDEADLAKIKARMVEMEAEAAKLKAMQEKQKEAFDAAAGDAGSEEARRESDARSIYIGSVDYSSTAEDLEKHFMGCGKINRVTLATDHFTGKPKGYAYLEFGEPAAVELALALNDSVFKGRQIQVKQKRYNVAGMNKRGRGRGRGRGRSYGGGYRGGYARRGRRGRGW
eukprot:m.434551 g.434551  ORF g.434551 m.434551 type:complete len:203 (+) comp17730_c0_seq1:89-697(+)